MIADDRGDVIQVRGLPDRNVVGSPAECMPLLGRDAFNTSGIEGKTHGSPETATFELSPVAACQAWLVIHFVTSGQQWHGINGF